MKSDRRHFLYATAGCAAALTMRPGAESADEPKADRAAGSGHSLARELGLVTASAHAQMTGKASGRMFTLLELPHIMREELDIRVVDLNTMSFPDFETVDREYLDRLRRAVDRADCVMTNLKMNQRGIDMNSRDQNVREKALAEYKRSIDIAAQLGCRWVRPLPGRVKPDRSIHVDSFRRLCEYAADRKVTLLVENFGWMQSDPDSVADLVRDIGDNVAAGVDTGNWDSNEIRYAGLEKSFPLAVTCDFKARRFDRAGQHAQYDLRRCFDIAWKCDFRGPWAFEYANADTKEWLTGIRRLRDLLRQWMDQRHTI